MKTNRFLLGSVVLASSLGLAACDSATATNDKTDEVKKVVTEKVAAAEEAVKKAPEAAQAAVEKAKEVVAPKAEAVADAAKGAMVAASETTKEVMASATEATKEVVASASETTKEAVATATEAAKDVAATATEKASSMVETAKKKVEAVTEAPAADTAAEAPQAQAVQAAVAMPEYKEGEHYVEIFPTMQTDAVGGKVEVVELMWLGCPHCYELEPTIIEYKKTLPDYVDFKQVPAMLNPRWIADGKMFYIAELLDPKGEKKLIQKIFHAIHVQKRRQMSSPDNLKSFMLQQGITAEEYDNAANSMALTAKLNRAQQISADSQAQSVPSIIINGKYRTSPYMAGGNKQLLQIMDMLTKRELEK